MKETAVNFLIDNIDREMPYREILMLLGKAKQIEEEQIMEAHYATKYGCFSEQYYNETYKKNKL